MSERYMQIGSTTCTLLVMVLVISVWEMSVPTEGTTGEYKTKVHSLVKVQAATVDSTINL